MRPQGNGPKISPHLSPSSQPRTYFRRASSIYTFIIVVAMYFYLSRWQSGIAQKSVKKRSVGHSALFASESVSLPHHIDIPIPRESDVAHATEETFREDAVEDNPNVDDNSEDGGPFPLQMDFKFKPKTVTGPPPGGYCRQPLNRPSPYPWLCHATSDSITIEGPDGAPITAERIGQFHSSEGEHIFHFNVDQSGTHLVRSAGAIIANFSTHPDRCFCPEPLSDFRKRFQCHDDDRALLAEVLSRWLPHNVSMDEFERFGFSEKSKVSLVRLSVVNNSAFYATFEGKKSLSMDSEKCRHSLNVFKTFLQSVLRKVKVPDSEFYFSYSVGKPFFEAFAPCPPIVGQEFNDFFCEIPIPAVEEIEHLFDGSFLRYAASGRPWNLRKPFLFFPGFRDQQGQRQITDHKFEKRLRLAVANSSLLEPNFFNQSKFSATSSFDSDYDDVAAMDESSTNPEPPQHKYVLNSDSVDSLSRLRFQVASGAFLLKQKSTWGSWWHKNLLQDRLNYVDVGRNFEGLRESLDWLPGNDDAAEEIARNLFHTWAQRLRVEDAFCWMATFLDEVSKKLSFEPTVRAGMESLDLELSQDKTCNCTKV